MATPPGPPEAGGAHLGLLSQQTVKEKWFPQEVWAWWLSGTAGSSCPGPPLILAGLGRHPPHPPGREGTRQSLAPAHPMLPKHCCPQDVEEADLFQITGQPDLDLVKIVPACSKATVWEPGLPSSDLAHSCSRTTLWGQTGSMCTEALRVAQQPVVGPGCPARAQRPQWGCPDLLGAGPSMGPQGEKAFSQYPEPLVRCGVDRWCPCPAFW